MLQLTEYKRDTVDALTTAERVALQEVFGATIRTLPDGSVEVQPGNVVGSVLVAGRPVVVRPKITIDRVLFMTAYATDPYRWRDDWSAVAGVDDLVEGMTALFVRACERTLGQGLLRSYRTIEDDLPVVKGRIRWQQQARRPAPVPIAVRYAVHDDDIAENRVLRAAVARLRYLNRAGGSSTAGLERVWRQVRHLTPTRDPLALLDRVRWTRLNERYRPLLALARVILKGSMADVRAGAASVPGFTLHLFDVFERFVRTALREASGLPESDFPVGESGLRLDEQHQVVLKPDLAVRRGGRWCFVGDVKYKRDGGDGQNGDLYQLLSYATATDLPDATLIYADGPSGPRHHVVRHAGTRLHLRHLDLSRSPKDVLQQLAAVAAELVLPASATDAAGPDIRPVGARA